MTKITKREYNSKKTELQTQIADIKKKLQVLDTWSNSLDWNNVTEHIRQKFDKLGDYWNRLHDKKHELEQELQFLEDRWETRNWTGSDWNSWELITSNID